MGSARAILRRVRAGGGPGDVPGPQVHPDVGTGHAAAGDHPLDDTGLELALALLVVADRYEALRPAHEPARSPVPLYDLLLDMLDRLDEWETYLAVWQQLRRHTTDTLTYGDGPQSAATGARAAPYVMRRTPGQIHLHGLWLLSHRKDLIARKLA